MSEPLTPEEQVVEELDALDYRPEKPDISKAAVEALAKQSAFICETRGHGGLWPSRENCQLCAVTSALTALAERVEETVALAIKFCEQRDKEIFANKRLRAQREAARGLLQQLNHEGHLTAEGRSRLRAALGEGNDGRA